MRFALPELIWQALTLPLVAMYSVLPRRVRYRTAIGLARKVERYVGAALMRRPHRYTCSTRLDETIRSSLRIMARWPIPFEPSYRAEVDPDFLTTVRDRGAILVTGHFALNALVNHYVHDHGCSPTVVRGNPAADEFIWGTSQRISTLRPRRSFFLSIRALVTPGQLAMMAIDRAQPERRTVAVETPFTRFHVSTAIFRFAKRCGLPLFFCCGRTDPAGEVVVVVRRIEPELRAFASALQEQTAHMGAPPSNPAGNRPSS